MFKTINLKKAVIPILLVVITLIGAGLSRSHAEEKSSVMDKSESVFVPVIMYHSVRQDKTQCGEYVVTSEQVSEDIRYLKQNNFTPIFIRDLIDHVKHGGTLPDKPVVLTFDDGFYDNYEYLYPILKKENFKATVSVVGEFTTDASESADPPNAAYSYLRWKDISDMQQSGFYEFCNHTYSLHGLEERRGILSKEGESAEYYETEVTEDIISLQKQFEQNCGFEPNIFTFPYGFKDEKALDIVKSCGFEAAMDVEEKPNFINKDDPECLYHIHRYNRSGLTDTSAFMERLLSGCRGG